MGDTKHTAVPPSGSFSAAPSQRNHRKPKRARPQKTNKKDTGTPQYTFGKPLNKNQVQIHKEHQKFLAQSSNVVSSFFGDNQPTTGASELRFDIIDWVERPLAPQTAGQPVYTYFLDVGRPFFADASAVAGENFTRSKVRRVKLWYLSPATVQDNVPLLQVLTSIPVHDESNNSGVGSASLLGQSNTIIHPDVRQPWVMVGNWNWETIFENSQYQPLEVDTTAIPEVGARDPMALFNFLVIDATTGDVFTDAATGKSSLKVEIELQAPIPLVPTPLRVEATSPSFVEIFTSSTYAANKSPVQYVLKGIHREM